jgi:hypothetical protein
MSLDYGTNAKHSNEGINVNLTVYLSSDDGRSGPPTPLQVEIGQKHMYMCVLMCIFLLFGPTLVV